jgi:hypothetical protein
MRWRDGTGTKWRLRQQRLGWRRLVKPEAAFNLLPDGLGDDPISFVIALPFLVVFAVLLPFWLIEFVARLLVTPVVAVLRLAGMVPYRLELFKARQLMGSFTAAGRSELVRLRKALRADPA